MVEDSAGFRRIAQSLAVHLAHLREFKGIRFVPDRPMPRFAVEVIQDGSDVRTDARPAAATNAVSQATIAVAGSEEQRHRPQPQETQPQAQPEQRQETQPSVEQASRAGPRPGTQRPQPASRGQDNSRELQPARSQAGQSVPPQTTVAKASEWSAAKKLDYLRTRNIGDCRRCGLAQGRTHIVFGVGNPEADLMFVGEAPGYNEDRQGIPFVGRAGERLNLWLDMLGVPRDNAYIANVLKCRPSQNRDPQPAEIERCSAFLHAQIRAIRPKVLIALGRFAGNLLTSSQDQPLWKMRGRVLTYREAKHGTTVPTIVTYHPSYVLRQPGSQAAGQSKEDLSVLDDLRRAVEILRSSRS